MPTADFKKIIVVSVSVSSEAGTDINYNNYHSNLAFTLDQQSLTITNLVKGNYKLCLVNDLCSVLTLINKTSTQDHSRSSYKETTTYT